MSFSKSFLAVCLALPLTLALSATGLSLMAQDMRDGLPFKPDPVKGYQTAQKLCTGCHVIDKGQTGTAKPGVPSFLYMANKPDQTGEKLAHSMIHPFPPMIDTHLTTHEIKDISTYILSLKPAKQ